MNSLKSLLLIILAAGSTAASAEEPRMGWLDNGRLRLGVDLSIGGAITHLSETNRGKNMINSHDWGRQIQMSFYSGPVPFVPQGATASEHWKRNTGNSSAVEAGCALTWLMTRPVKYQTPPW